MERQRARLWQVTLLMGMQRVSWPMVPWPGRTPDGGGDVIHSDIGWHRSNLLRFLLGWAKGEPN
jgi:hypothetical protein